MLPLQKIVFRLVHAVMMISTLVTSYGIVPHGILKLSTAFCSLSMCNLMDLPVETKAIVIESCYCYRRVDSDVFRCFRGMRRKLSAKGISCSQLRYRRSLGRVPVTNSRSSDVADIMILA